MPFCLACQTLCRRLLLDQIYQTLRGWCVNLPVSTHPTCWRRARSRLLEHSQPTPHSTQAGGLFTGVYGVATDGTSQWGLYRQENDFAQVSDYLACLMTSSLALEAYQNNQQMQQVCREGQELYQNTSPVQNTIDQFNEAIAGITTRIAEQCGAHNCLNASTIEPSQRNSYPSVQGSVCMSSFAPANPSQCANFSWDPHNPMTCYGSGMLM